MKNKPSPPGDKFRRDLSVIKADKDAEAHRKRQEAKDRELLDYIVFDGHPVHRTPHFQEAANLARSTNARVYWALEGAMVGEINL